MKPAALFVLFCITLPSKSFAQDTIRLADASSRIGQKVTFRGYVADFDLRTEYIYLYFGNRYPNQLLTVAIQRTNGKKHIKLKRDVILGRETVYFTGTISNYSGDPDTSANYDTVAIKKDIETYRPMLIGGKPMTAHFNYIPRTAPIDLKGKLVMVVTEQGQIGRKTYPVTPLQSNPLVK